MIESVIAVLIGACILALIVYLVLWVVRDLIGVAIPPKIIQIIWVIVALIIILWLVQLLIGGGRGVPRLVW